MQVMRHRARLDWLAEVGGASALGLASGFAALKAAPSLGFVPAVGVTAGGLVSFILGLLGMRAVRPDLRTHKLAGFAVAPIKAIDVLLLTEVVEGPLLLDTPYEEPAADHALLLEDALPQADPASRVIQLFASPPMPTPGELRDRIDRHLATGAMHVVREFEGPAPDASDALFAALDELKRSLR